MKIVKEIDQEILENDICLVPTMGALHESIRASEPESIKD